MIDLKNVATAICAARPPPRHRLASHRSFRRLFSGWLIMPTPPLFSRADFHAATPHALPRVCMSVFYHYAAMRVIIYAIMRYAAAIIFISSSPFHFFIIRHFISFSFIASL